MPIETRPAPRTATDTPASDLSSVYFDAPIAIFHTSTATPTVEEEPSAPHNDHHVFDMSDVSNNLPPPVHSNYPRYSAGEPVTEPAPMSPIREQGAEAKPQASPSSRLVQHPNGSEGWLPTEEPAHPNLDSSLPHAPGSVLLPQHHHHDEGRDAVVVTDLNTLATSGSPPRRTSPTASVTAANTAHNAGHHETPAGGTGLGPGMPEPAHTQQHGATGYALIDAGVQPQPQHATGASAIDRSASRRSAISGVNTLGAQSVNAFSNGAGAIGPPPNHEDELRVRQAGATLTPKERKRINEEELKHNRRLSKIIQSEGKAEKRAMANALTELEDLQKKQKHAIKAEEQLLELAKKQGAKLAKAKAALLSAQMRYDSLSAEHNSTESTLARVRNDAMEITERMQTKTAEVEALRRTLEVDERERGVRLGTLSRRR